MPRPQRPWFRFYVEAIADIKLVRMSPAHRWLWVVVLAQARMSPVPGVLLVAHDQPMTPTDLHLVAHIPLRDVNAGIDQFVAQNMLEVTLQGWRVVNWNERQYESDDVTLRTRKHRSREQGRNVPTAFPGTPPDTETEYRYRKTPPSTQHLLTSSDPYASEEEDVL